MSFTLSHPRFVVGRLLGQGGFGTVCSAFDRERNATVALKRLHRAELRDRDRFKAEFRALSQLSHPGLPALFELFHHEGAWFFTMELVPGVTFLDHVRLGMPSSRTAPDGAPGLHPPTLSRTVGEWDNASHPVAMTRPGAGPVIPVPVDRARLRSSLDQLLTTLEFLHGHDKLHRDIKPSNVLVRDDGRVFVLDFGLIASSNLPIVGAAPRGFEGTPAYASPEQCLGEELGPATDLYAVGVLLYESLIGARPFTGDARQLMLDKVQFAAPLVPDGGDADLRALCTGLLSRDPAERLHAVARYGRAPASALDTPGRRSLGEGSIFVGREAELGQIAKAYEASRGRPHVLLIEGASALGKSALVREALRRIENASDAPPVFCGRASDRERVAFNAFDSVAEEMGRRFAEMPAHRHDLALVARLFPTLRADSTDEAGASEVAAVPDEAVRYEAFSAVRRLLHALATQHPIVWLDDLQWADGDSVALLTALLREPFAPEVFFVLTRRPLSEGQPASAPLPAHTERLVLGALPPADIAALVDLMVDRDFDEGRREQICAASGGVPLFAAELTRTASGADIPASLSDAILARVAGLAPASRRALLLVCLANVPVHDRQLAGAIDTSPEALSRILEELRALSLVRTEQAAGARVHLPFHDRIRETLEDALGPADRRDIHGALADALGSTASGPDEARDAAPMVAHLRSAGRDEEAARYVLPAAQRAEATFGYERAARLYREALRLVKFLPLGERALRLALASVLERALLSHDAAEEYLGLAAIETDPVAQTQYREKACRLYLWSGELDRGLVTLEVLLGRFSETMPVSQAAALLELMGAQTVSFVQESVPWLRASVAPDHDAVLARYNLLRGAGEGLGMIDNVRGALFHSRAFRVSRTLSDPMLRAEALGLEAIFRGCAGSLGRTRARVLLRELCASFPEGLPPRAQVWHDAATSVTEMQGAPTARAARRIQAAEQGFIDLQAGDAWAVSSCRLIRALTLRIVGDMEQLRVVIPELLSDADRRNDRYVAATIGRGSFILWKADDVPDLGWKLLAAQTWPRVEGSFHLQEWVGLDAACELYMYEGRGLRCWDDLGDDLRRLGRAPFNLLIQSVRVLVAYLLGRLEVIRAHETRSRSSRLRALRHAWQLGLEGALYAKARSALLRASIAALDGKDSAVHSHLRKARALAVQGELPLLEAMADYLIARIERRDRGPSADKLRAMSIKNPARFVASEIPAMQRWL